MGGGTLWIDIASMSIRIASRVKYYIVTMTIYETIDAHG